MYVWTAVRVRVRTRFHPDLGQRWCAVARPPIRPPSALLEVSLSLEHFYYFFPVAVVVVVALFFSHNRHRTRRRVLFPRDNGTHHARRRFCAVVDLDRVRGTTKIIRTIFFFHPVTGGATRPVGRVRSGGRAGLTRSLHIIKIYMTTTSTRGPRRARLEKVPAADFCKTFPYQYK